MNINDYIARFKDTSFKSLAFNDVDSLILSQLSYINFDLVCGTYLENKKPIRIKDIKIKDRNFFFKDSADNKYDEKMLKLLQTSKRFQNLEVGFYCKSHSKEHMIQFYAITIFLPKYEIFISFRGTDTSILGWKEDFLMAFKPELPSYLIAMSYTDFIINKYPDHYFYLGGHSKGGNIAFYVASNLNEEKSKRLINAFSFDGPGFKDGINKFPYYELNRHKLLKYMTNNDLIGLLYETEKPYKVVYSTGLLLGGHDPFFWAINSKGRFVTVNSVSSYAKRRAKRLLAWLNSLSVEDSELLFQSFFRIFGENETIYDLGKNLSKDFTKNRAALLKELSEEDKKKLGASLKKFANFMLSPSVLVEKKKNK